VPSTSATLTVQDANGTDSTASFGLETIDEGGGIKHYRIYINDNFVFINNTNLTTFTFSISIIFPDTPVPTVFEEIAQLENVAPTILNSCPATLALPAPTSPPGVPIYTFQAVNGANSTALKQVETQWTILGTSTTGWESLFSIVKNPTTGDGEIFLLDTFPITETFTLNVQIKDGVSSAGIPTDNTELKYRSQTDTCSLTISIGTVEICGRTWSARNVEVTTYADGTAIPQVTDPAVWANLKTGAWCYYNNDPANGAIYGKLYNWYAIMGITTPESVPPTGPEIAARKQFAPDGFHVPFGVSGKNELCNLWYCTSGTPTTAGGTLKEEGFDHWDNPNTGATNSTSFTALPGGVRNTDGTFSELEQTGAFWFGGLESGDPFAEQSEAWKLTYTSAAVSALTYPSNSGLSVRFIDNTLYDYIAGTSGSFCTYEYLNDQGQLIQATLGGSSGPEYDPFQTAAFCSITGSCDIFPD
jgi:uncharacterized protein (TIGR02145 family)